MHLICHGPSHLPRLGIFQLRLILPINFHAPLAHPYLIGL